MAQGKKRTPSDRTRHSASKAHHGESALESLAHNLQELHRWQGHLLNELALRVEEHCQSPESATDDVP